MPQKFMRKKKQKDKSKVIVNFGDVQEIADSREKDFELDIDASSFRAKKGKVARVRANKDNCLSRFRKFYIFSII